MIHDDAHRGSGQQAAQAHADTPEPSSAVTSLPSIPSETSVGRRLFVATLYAAAWTGAAFGLVVGGLRRMAPRKRATA